MERRDHDRVPRHESFWPETITRWQAEGLDGDADDVLRLLGSDFASLCWLWPQAFPGSHRVLSEDEETRVVRESNGRIARYWKHRSGTPEHLGFECDSRQTWHGTFKPALLKHWHQLDVDAAVARCEQARRDGKWSHLTGVETFEETRQMLGDEVTLMAMIEDPEWIIDVSRTFTDVLLQNFQLVLDRGARPDGLWIYGDMAFKTATMCSPAMYRQLVWPDHRRLADFAHRNGMKCIYHTDGNVNGVMDLYVEAGFDCLQPLEAKAGMDVRDLVPRYGDRLSFFGNMDVMVMATNDPVAIEHEIAAKLAVARRHSGYLYHSDHSVPPSVSWQTYQRIIAWVDQYGRYDAAHGSHDPERIPP